MNLEIANKLQQLRKDKGYSQEELAEQLGVSRQAVSKWERAEASPDTDNLIALSKIYNVSLDELLGINNKKEETIDEEIEENEEPKNKAVDIFENISTLVIAIIYVIIGACFHLWHPGWLIFLLIPIVSSIFEVIKTKKISSFSFPVLITIIYLFLGFIFDLWHPFWFLFILIPVFYVIVGIVEKKKN